MRQLRGVLAALLLIAPAGAAAAGPVPPPGSAHRAPTAGSFSVTLVTGDRVSARSATGDGLSVQPAAGRERVSFSVEQVGGSVFVVPRDARALVSSGTVDRRLFDVTGLIRDGYHDAARPTVPLIVTTQGTGAARRARSLVTGSGVTVTRELPAVNSLAVSARKSDAAGFWGRVVADGGGGAKIWLDGRRRLSIDASVPQVGAPAAWQAGSTGRGVTVAVLDTGVDDTHPDLAGKVAESVNFSAAPNSRDEVGHGTHVAATMVGSGLASAGRYRGVAPDATLISGKVCESDSCFESAILAGMQWASAEKKATAVNLSLGIADTPGTDPVEAAVETLTADHGTLFVVAAGNRGAEYSVGSPASADAALAVGAVDRSDGLAGFSSRGPRLGDDAIKPEITAPGVGIVAARAAGATIGEPVGDRYLRLSGTSMAAPHVTGAAALLAQRHPNWTADRLKAALVGSARNNPDLGAYQQGAGRLDVAAAITQSVRAEPVSLSLGRAAYPHADDEPITRTVTYHNEGTGPVTLDLALKVTGPSGPAPAGMFTVGADRVTVPAGGTAAVTVTADTRLDAADGLYTGTLTARSPQMVVTTPVAVNRETELYDLTISTIDLDGKPAGSAYPFVQGVDSDAVVHPVNRDGTATVRLPRGVYTVTTFFSYPDELTPEVDAMLVRPTLNLTADTTLVMDSRTARPVRMNVPEPSAVAAAAVMMYTLRQKTRTVSAGIVSHTFDGMRTAHVGPPGTNDGFIGALGGQWAEPGPNGDFYGSPYLYAAGEKFPGMMPTGYERTYGATDFATVRPVILPSQADGTHYERSVEPDFGMPWRPAVVAPREHRMVEYYNASVAWRSSLLLGQRRDPWPIPSVEPVAIFEQTEPVSYRPGRVYTERWNGGPLGPALPRPPAGAAAWGLRDPRVVAVNLPLYGDGTGRAGTRRYAPEVVARTALYRNGTLVGESDRSGYGVFEVAPDDAAYRLEASDTRGGVELSTRIEASWTFRSTAPADGWVPLPLMAVRFTPRLDDHNAAPAGRPFTIPVRVQRQAGAPDAAVRRLTVEVSYDDGATWQPLPVRGGAVTARHPDAAGFVSLRADATDSAGNTVRQTIIRAYRIGR